MLSTSVINLILNLLLLYHPLGVFPVACEHCTVTKRVIDFDEQYNKCEQEWRDTLCLQTNTANLEVNYWKSYWFENSSQKFSEMDFHARCNVCFSTVISKQRRTNRPKIRKCSCLRNSDVFEITLPIFIYSFVCLFLIPQSANAKIRRQTHSRVLMLLSYSLLVHGKYFQRFYEIALQSFSRCHVDTFRMSCIEREHGWMGISGNRKVPDGPSPCVGRCIYIL